MSQQVLVEMRGISKSFGPVQALKDVDFTVCRGEVMGLVGDNGAGKSTLIKILTGVIQPDKGDIYLEGRKVRITSPRQARQWGIETVYQDLAVFPLMSVTRNIYVGREPVRRFGFLLRLIDLKTMERTTSQLLSDLGVRIHTPRQRVQFLSGGERQSVAIARAILFGAKLLILDEPTAALSVKESEKVLEFVLEARRRGLSVVFITHNIYHVYSVADRFTILDRGRKIAELRKERTSPEEVINIIRSGQVSFGGPESCAQQEGGGSS